MVLFFKFPRKIMVSVLHSKAARLYLMLMVVIKEASARNDGPFLLEIADLVSKMLLKKLMSVSRSPGWRKML